MKRFIYNSGRKVFVYNGEFREEDHPRAADGKFGKGGIGKEKKKEKPAESFSNFIKHMINVDLSEKMEETKIKGIATLYTDGVDENTLVDISRFSRQYKKYKVADGGRNKINIIYPESKFWETHSFNWQPNA